MREKQFTPRGILADVLVDVAGMVNDMHRGSGAGFDGEDEFNGWVANIVGRVGLLLEGMRDQDLSRPLVTKYDLAPGDDDPRTSLEQDGQ